MTDTTPPADRRTPTWVKVLLAVSLALNLLVAGIVVGARFGDGPHGHDGRPGPRGGFDPALGPFSRALPEPYRDRALDTRLGTLNLRVPKLRQGSYFPGFLEARKTSEQALVAVIQEAWIGGVSTRRVDELVQAMGLSGISKSTVSKLCKMPSSSCSPIQRSSRISFHAAINKPLL